MDSDDVGITVMLLGLFLFFSSLGYFNHLNTKERQETLRICLENVKDVDKCYREE